MEENYVSWLQHRNRAVELVRNARRLDNYRNVAFVIWTIVGLLALFAWQW